MLVNRGTSQSGHRFSVHPKQASIFSSYRIDTECCQLLSSWVAITAEGRFCFSVATHDCLFLALYTSTPSCSRAANHGALLQTKPVKAGLYPCVVLPTFILVQAKICLISLQRVPSCVSVSSMQTGELIHLKTNPAKQTECIGHSLQAQCWTALLNGKFYFFHVWSCVLRNWMSCCVMGSKWGLRTLEGS